MAKCCGGDAATPILRAKNFWLDGGTNNTLMATNDVNNTDVRLQFVGPQTGAITFRGVSGREYRAGNNDYERFIDVDPGDVEKLLALRYGGAAMFEVVDLTAAKAEIEAARAESAVEVVDLAADQVESADAPVESADAPVDQTSADGDTKSKKSKA